MYVLIATIAILSVLSLVQRLTPWLVYKNRKGEKVLVQVFDYVAVSAFGSLMVENIQSLSASSLIPLIVALVIAYRTRNVGATVLAALLTSLLLGAFVL